MFIKDSILITSRAPTVYLATTELPTWGPQGGQNGHLPLPLENGTKKQKFLENVKSTF